MAMTKSEAEQWVRDHADDDDLDGDELFDAFRAIFGREPDAADRAEGLWSHLCAALATTWLLYVDPCRELCDTAEYDGGAVGSGWQRAGSRSEAESAVAALLRDGYRRGHHFAPTF
jgi:hypothetical protein